jgi:release factor glutamine methyltransferase
VHVRQALHQARDVLVPVSDSPSLDARVLLADTLGTSPTWLLAHDDEVLPIEAEGIFVDRLRRYAGGEPLPYVLGWWEFYGRRFSVSASVLIPRPETELLVDLALSELRRRGAPARVIDVGTGSGCIAVSLAAAAPGFTVVATDVSRQALEVARANAKAHKVRAQLQLVQSSLLDGLTGGWDLVCANLPYVATERLPYLAVARREPKLALDGGRRGTELTAHVVRSLNLGLAPGGLALLEIDEDQAEELMAVAHESMGDAVAEIVVDLTGRPRLLQIQRSHGDD